MEPPTQRSRTLAWCTLIASLVVAVAAVVVLADVHDGAVDVPVGVVLVGALAVLARTAMRLAA